MRSFKCLSVDITNMRHFTIGKIYETDDNMLNYRLDGGHVVDYCPLIEDGDVKRGLIFEEVKEGENKMEDLRELIKPCYAVKFRGKDNGWCIAMNRRNGIIGFNSIDNISLGITNLSQIDENLSDTIGCSSDYDIMEIRGYADVNQAQIEYRPLIWKREEKSPTQIKIEEIESTIAQLTNQVNELKSK